MRDLLLIAALGGVLPLALLRPWIGLLLWVVVSIAAPHQMSWGLSGQPVGQLVAAIVVIGYLCFREGTRGIPMRFPIVAMIVFWGWTGVTTAFAVYPDIAWEEFTEHSKMLLFVLLATTLFQERRRLHVLFGVLVGALGFYAVKGALFSLANGAQNIVFGPENTSFYDNNDFALGLNMLLPLAILMARSSETRYARLAWMGVTGAIVLSVLFTYSRGGVVALAALMAMTILRSKQRIPAIVVGIFVLAAAALLAPAHWVDRVASIADYEQDASVSGRFNAWYFSWNLAMDHPVAGGGFGVFTPEMFARYAPNPDSVFVAHSVYFDLIASHGFVGLALYLILIASVFWRAGRLRARARRTDARWAADAAEAIQLSLVAFLVGGAFLSQTWNEIVFYLVAAQVLLEVVAAPEEAEQDEPLPLWEPEEAPCAA